MRERAAVVMVLTTVTINVLASRSVVMCVDAYAFAAFWFAAFAQCL